MDFDILIPRMTLEGNFKIGGNLAQIPIKGKGYYNSSIGELENKTEYYTDKVSSMKKY